MSKIKVKKLFSIILAIILMLTMLTNVAFANQPNDITNHWAKEVINDWIARGLANGYSDNTFRPNNHITRAEFMSLTNNAFNFESETDISFTDVTEKDWYYNVVKRGFAAGYMNGYPDGTIKPKELITRQEVAMILARIKELPEDLAATNDFTDNEKIPQWSKGSIGAVYKAGYMSGYPEGHFGASNYIRRAEAIVSLDRAMKVNSTIYDIAGTYGPASGTNVINGDVVISSNGIILQNLVIKGSLTIAENIGKGTIKLLGVTVEGETFIHGGGKESIHIVGGNYKTINIKKTADGGVRIIATDITGLEIVVAEDALGENIIFEGAFNKITVEAEGILLQTQGNTTINDFIVSPKASNATLSLSSDTLVNKITIEGEKTVVNGDGTIKEAIIKVSGVVFEQEPNKLIVDEGVEVPLIEANQQQPPPSSGSPQSPPSSPPPSPPPPSPVVPSNPKIITITPVENVMVPYGTEETTAVVSLSPTTTILDSNNTTHTVNLSWSIEDYDGNVAGTYSATGIFSLPAGVDQSQPPMDLRVIATITVRETVITNPIIVSITPVDDISVEYGTDEALAIANLPQTTTILDSDNITRIVSLSWSIEGYDGNVAGTYSATGNFLLPAGVDQSEPPMYLRVIATITVRAIVISNPSIVSITSVDNISVEYGTDEATAINSLPPTTTILDSDNTTHTVNLSWSIEGYDGNIAGEYIATGTFLLPAGVDQCEPPMDLRVIATITVRAIVISNPSIVSITSVDNISVEYGTDEATAINSLPPTTTILDSDNTTHTINLSWSIEGYDGNIAGEYIATGTFLLPAGVDQCEPPMELKVDATVTVNNILYQISGQVFNPNNNELEEIVGLLVTNLDLDYSYWEFTDDNGCFRLMGLEDGDYEFRAIPQVDFQYTESPPVIVSIIDGIANPSSFNLTLSNPQILGAVKKTDGGEIDEHINIHIKNTDTDYYYWKMTDISGNFKVGGLQDGIYEITAIPNDESLFLPAQSETVVIVNGEAIPTSLEFRLTSPQLIGKVITPNGDPLDEYVRIYLQDVISGYRHSYDTNSQGSFSIAGLPDGIYDVRAIPNTNSQYTASEFWNVEITNGIPKTISLQLSHPQVLGVVMAPDGSEINEEVTINVVTADGRGQYSIISDLAGNFKLGGLIENQEYHLFAYTLSSSQYYESLMVPIIISNEVREIEISLTLPQITGQIKDPNGENLSEYVLIHFRNVSNGNGYGRGTGDNGFFRIGGIPDGTYDVRAIPTPDSLYTASEAHRISIINGDPQVINLQLTTSQITGVVQSPYDTSINEEVSMHIFDTNGTWLFNVRSTISGNFKIGGLIVGDEYFISAYAYPESQYYESEMVPIIITEDVQEIVISLTVPQITGQVMGPNGENLTEYVSIHLRNVSDGNGYGRGTDYNGNLRIGGLVDGTYELRAIPEFESQYTASTPILITINNGTPDIPIVEIRLTTPQVTGVIKNAENETVNERMYIEVIDKDGYYQMHANTNNEGNFKLGGLEIGETYRIKAYPNNDSQYVESQWVELTITEDIISDFTITLQYPQITGQVMGPNGENLTEWVSIHLRNVSNGNGYGRGTDYNGNLRIGGLVDGTYELRAIPEFESQYTASTPILITINNGTPDIPIVEIRLTTPQVTGVIKNAENETVNERMYIEVIDKDGYYQMHANTNSQGNFKLGGLEIGKTYRVKAYPNNDSQYVASQWVELTITGEIISDFTITLQYPQITGLVKSPDGSAINEFVSINIRSVSLDYGYSHGAGTDKRGNFKIGGLSDGIYEVRALPRPDSLYTASIATIVVISNGEAEFGDLTLALTNPKVIGVVKDQENNTINERIHIEVIDSEGRYIMYTNTNQQGSFKLGGLDIGETYRIKAYPNNDSQYVASQWVELTITEENVNNFTVILQYPQITGQVKAPNGSIINEYVSINIRSLSLDYGYSYGSETDNQGNFKLGGLSDGMYEVRALPQQDSHFTASFATIIVISNGEANMETLILNLTNPKVIGVVKNPENNTINERIHIEVIDSAGRYIMHTNTDKQGNFKFGGLEVGETYRVKAYPNNDSQYVASQWIELTITEENANDFTITLQNTQITGQVKAPDGSIINEYVSINIRSALDYDYNHDAETDSQGNFKLGGLEVGQTYRIKAYPNFNSQFGPSEEIEITISEELMHIELQLGEKQLAIIHITEPQWEIPSEFKILTIIYPLNSINRVYSFDEVTWHLYSEPLVITENCYVYTRAEMPEGTLVTGGILFYNIVE